MDPEIHQLVTRTMMKRINSCISLTFVPARGPSNPKIDASDAYARLIFSFQVMRMLWLKSMDYDSRLWRCI
jgi:hypothetical protein